MKDFSYRHFRRLPSDRKLALVMLWPSLVGALIFFLLPFGVIVYYSLIDGVFSRRFAGLDNFVRLLHNSAFLTAGRNTLVFSALAVPLAVLLALILALLLEARIPMKSRLRSFFLAPMMVPVASVVLIWQVIFHYNGVLNSWLTQTLQLTAVDWFHSGWSLVAIIALFLWKNLGYNMILFMAALANIPRELLEVTALDTSSSWQVFRHVKLYWLTPSLLFVTILSLINSFKVFREVYLLTGDHPTEDLYMLQHFMNNTFKALDYQKLSAAAVIMAIVMVAIIALLFWAEDRFGRDVEG